MEKESERLVYVRDEWVPESKASIHIYDSQFMFGDAVFEMHRTFNHIPFLLDEHLDRLFMSMKMAHIVPDKTRDELVELCNESMRLNAQHFVNDEFRFMINVSRGPLGIYREIFGDDWNRPTWVINAWPLSKTAKTLAPFYRSGVNAVVVPQRQIPAQFLDPKVKSRSRLHYNIANMEVRPHGSDALAVLLDDDGYVCEGTGSNFLMIKNGAIVAPEERNILRGCSMWYVTRVIAHQLNIPVFYQNIEPYDALDADEAMFTGTFVNVLPCDRFNGHRLCGVLDGEVMGPITKMICDQWSKNVGVDFIKQIKEWEDA